MSDIPPIITSRLRLDSVRPETLELLLEGDREDAEAVQGLTLSDEFIRSVDERFLAIQLNRMRFRPSGQKWCIRAIVRLDDNEVIGHSGFHGPPEDVGRLEIGYNVLPPHRRNGYATETVRGLADWAHGEGVTPVYAAISPGNAASIGVVQKLGFLQTGSQEDEVDGEEYLYQLDVSK